MALNSEPAQHELTRLKTGDDLALEKAVKSPLILRSSMEEVKQVLRLVMIKMGLRSQNWPNEEEKIVLIEHIVSNFGGNRVEEIKLAFEMAIAGKLDIEDVRCYENFSCAYFSMIMTAYRHWAEQAYRFLKLDPVPEQKIFSQQELDDSQREDAEIQYQRFLKGYELRGLDINKSILESDKLLKEGETALDFFKRRALNGSINIYKKDTNGK